MSRSQIRVRTLLIAITVVALVCWVEILRRRSAEFARLSIMYRRLEMDYMHRVEVADVGIGFANKRISKEGELPKWKEQLQWWSEQSEKNKKMLIHYREINRRFQAATRRPWAYPPSQEDVPSPEPDLPPPDLPLIFTADPKTGVISPL
jgi:hypothetical protein